MTPALIAAILRWPSTAILARIALTTAYWWAGLSKLLQFQTTVGEMSHFGLPAPALLAGLTIFVELVGSAMLIMGWMPWLAAGALAVFTAWATLLAHAFWTFPPAEQFREL